MRVRIKIFFGLAYIALLYSCSSIDNAMHQDSLANQSATKSIQTKNTEPPIVEPIKTFVLRDLIKGDLNLKRGNVNDALYTYIDRARSENDKAIVANAYSLAKASANLELITEMSDLLFELDPENPSSHIAKIESYLLLKKSKDALTHGYWIYHNIGDINPLLFIISQQQIMGHSPDSIIKSISNISESGDNKYSKMFLSGIVYNQSGDERKAEIFLRKALLEKPNDSQATIILAQILNRTGGKKKALILLSNAVAEKSNDVNLMRRYAEYLSDEDPLLAISEFEKISNLDPDNTNIAYMLALLYLSQGNENSAKAILKTIKNNAQKSNDTQFYLGNIAESEGHVTKAIFHYSKVESGQKYLLAQEKLINLFAETSSYDEVRNYLHSERKTRPNFAKNLYQIEANLLLSIDKKHQAYNLLTEALSKFPKDVNLLYMRSMSADGRETFNKMEADLRSILDLSSSNPIALNALGYSMLIYTDRTNEAYDLIKKAYDLNPSDPATIDSLGWAHFKLGNIQDALYFLRRAYQLNKDAEIAAHLGEVLWSLEKREEAVKIISGSYKEYPKNDTLIKTIRKLDLNIESES